MQPEEGKEGCGNRLDAGIEACLFRSNQLYPLHIEVNGNDSAEQYDGGKAEQGSCVNNRMILPGSAQKGERDSAN